MNCILGLDILISFNSAYYDETDELIISRKKITIKVFLLIFNFSIWEHGLS